MKKTLFILLLLAFAIVTLSAQAHTILDENFDQSLNVPDEWWDDSGVDILADIGVDGSNAVSYNCTALPLWGMYWDFILATPALYDLSATSTLSFAYRITAPDNPNVAGSFGNSMFEIYFTDADDLNQYELVWELDSHIESVSYRTITIPLNSITGQTGRILFYSGVEADEQYTINLDDVKITTTTAPFEYDLKAVSVTGNTHPSLNQPYDYTVAVRNLGTQTVTGTSYTVSLMLVGNNTPIGTQNGTDLTTATTTTFTFSWTPTATGNAQLYGNVTFVNDDNQTNNQTANLNINTLPVGTVYIGNPNSNDRINEIPFNLHYKQSLVQTIYLASEIGDPGTITSIAYNFRRAGSAPGYGGYPPNPLHIKIWMATTPQNAFNNALAPIPFNEFTLVYEGTMPVNTAGTNNITLTLQTPFAYRYDNLVVMTHREFTEDYFDSENNWRATEINQARSLVCFEDPAEAIPVPNANGDFPTFSAQYLMGYIPNTTLTIQEIVPFNNDLRAVSVTGKNTPTVNQAHDYTLTVQNVGEVTASAGAYSAYLMMVGNAQPIGFQTGTALASNGTTTFTFSWTPNAITNAQLYGMVTFTPDENPANNRTLNLPVFVQPVGVAYIGDPASPIRANETPFDLFYRQSLEQTIYTQEEIGGEGVILSIGYNFTRGGNNAGYSGYSPAPRDVQIWMANTQIQSFPNTQTALPFSAFTLVYEGTIPVHIAGNNDIDIILDTPFAFTGNNLVVMTHREFTPGYFASQNTWQITHTPGQDRIAAFRGDPGSAYVFPDANGGYSAFEFQDTFSWIPNTRLTIATGPFATITGTITDAETHTGIAGAKISLTGSNQFVFTNDSGVYTFPYLPVGTISITVYRGGYQTLTRDDIVTVANQTSTVDWQMTQMSGIPVTITVRTFDNGSALGSTVALINTDVSGLVYHTPVTSGNTAIFDNVVLGNYSLIVAQIGYYTYTIEIEVAGESFSADAFLGGIHTIFYQGFDDLSVDLPAGWTHYAINPEYPWHVGSETFAVNSDTGEPLYYYPHNQSAGMAISASYDNVGEDGPLNPNNYLITPLINIPSDSYGARLEYYVTTWNLWADHYGVYISTTGNAPVNFTRQLLDETAPGGDHLNQNWTLKTIDLSYYVGDNIYIAFRHFDSFNRYFLMLDDVRVVVSSPTSIVEEVILPVVSALKGNYPNPFNPSTTISFDIAHTGNVSIDVYNIKGQKVKTLTNEVFTAGRHNVVWNGDDASGRSVGSGVYFYRMVSKDFESVKKMILVK